MKLGIQVILVFVVVISVRCYPFSEFTGLLISEEQDREVGLVENTKGHTNYTQTNHKIAGTKSDENDDKIFKDSEYQNDESNQEDGTSPVPSDDFGFQNSCHMIIDVEDQCTYAREYCTDYKIGVIDYISFYYCQKRKWPSLMLDILILVILFTSLGITASEFLCPNLDTLAKLLKMSESLAGVTLLALGNASPDVFSTLEAMKINSPSLAIGQLIGAAMFITCVVVGFMAIFKPFRVNKKPFIRDTAFLIISITITMIFLSDQKLSMREAFAMMMLYLLYVAFVVFSDWFIKKRKNAEKLDSQIRNQSFNHLQAIVPTDLSVNDYDYSPKGSENELGTYDEFNSKFNNENFVNFEDLKDSVSLGIRPSIISALDFQHKSFQRNSTEISDQISLASLPSKSKSPSLVPYGSYRKTNPSLDNSNEEEPGIAPSNPDLFPTFGHSDKNSVQLLSTSFNEENNEERMPSQSLELLKTVSLSSQIHQGNTTTAVFRHYFQNFITEKIVHKSTGIYLIFPSLKDFSDKSVVEKIFTVICLPLTTVLLLTIPIVYSDSDRNIKHELLLENEYILTLIKCCNAPFIATLLIGYGNGWNISSFWMGLIPTLVSLCLGLFIRHVRKSYQNNYNSKIIKFFNFSIAFLGFIIAVTWISTIATELISIIKFFSIVFNLSDAILGVTIFAVGNSLGDFICNISVANMGFPMMALSACFGSPLLNVLLGIGCSSLYIIPLKGSDIEINFSNTLLVSFITVLVNLIFLLIMVPLNEWQMNKTIGLTMIGLWSIATFICIILEII
ncbi:hypothetical protein WICMUC_004247 [Wickerhamomyces mucosus]|uniref:Sodium/calcium exchanger membrane region domain-containing protein n=1 Tax=Wickerhamomyces mucosus TaxID=1378264 RepID=A0A9P8TBP9_9ASCO|nr:hypothetical protein WICMUC_004247 [Wickerhamomyces mucosus]